MIKIEAGVLVLDAPISKEDADAVNEFVRLAREQERERIIALFHEVSGHNGQTHHEGSRCWFCDAVNAVENQDPHPPKRFRDISNAE